MKAKVLICLFILLSIGFFQSAVAQQTREIVKENTERVSQLYQADKDDLVYEQVVTLATEIIQYRQQYPKEIIAQAYVLLAEVANSKGDSARAFQFAVDGLTYNPLPVEIQLNLEIKIAAGYFVKGQYHNVFHFVDQVFNQAKEYGLIKYQLLGLGYRAMANALIGESEKAYGDLVHVKELIDQHRQYAEYLELLEVIAISYHYLGDYQTALEMHERILKLRFALNKQNGIETTYYNLAGGYKATHRYDDAYNAYWEVKKIAEQENWPIKRAYAELGLGQVLLEQQDFQKAYLALIEAENSFKGQNLNKPYLSTLIALTKASYATKRETFAQQLLMLAEEISEIAEVSSSQIDLYLLLSNHYQKQGETNKALDMLNQYVELQRQFFKGNQLKAIQAPSTLSIENSNKEIALDLAESYEAHTEFSERLVVQERLVTIFLMTTLLLAVIILLQWFSYRSRKQNYVYEQLERPAYILPSPAQTKYIYHRAFKKARKYEYPLSVGYLTISNWQDLTFSFNKKVIGEVNKTIATLINEHVGEFDQTGQINDGEYIVLYPHQTSEQAQAKFEKLIEALKVRFFANLGEFSVNIRFSIATPTVQDIDPYIFLSRLSDVS
ncbi:GGDEF domain-containing protein [Thalassotalea sp. M1531]|uniref:GGDEF domain-containing protein n=1 Tax=Thalassotalea algicola TaxID=2716224 RepID=A0A7Y0Q6A8_9GAMM|nr:GGDEF domain-containing protein [Thalassotalea algicola]NMP30632.1 GGDEF domain-containing protein [Thalassotalea algicola]